VSGPQFGFSHATIDIPDLGKGFSDAVKGMGSGTDTSFAFRFIASDPGQAAVIAAAIDDDGDASLKLVVTPTGADAGNGREVASGDDVEYAQGFLHSYLPMQPTDNSYAGANCNFRVRQKPVQATEPV